MSTFATIIHIRKVFCAMLSVLKILLMNCPFATPKGVASGSWVDDDRQIPLHIAGYVLSSS